MAGRSNISLFAILLFVTILVAAVPFTGCQSGSGYKKLTSIKEGISFTYEYPSSYTVFSNGYQDGDPIIIPQYLPDMIDKEADREIRIDIFSTIPELPDANAFSNSFIKGAGALWNEFELIERSPVQGSGVSGEMIVFSGGSYTSFINFNQIKAWKIYLDYKGKVFTIALYSKIDALEGAEAEFQHLINSFQFLN